MTADFLFEERRGMNVRKDSQALSARFYFASSGGEIQEGREKADETIPPSAAEPGKGFFLSFLFLITVFCIQENSSGVFCFSVNLFEFYLL